MSAVFLPQAQIRRTQLHKLQSLFEQILRSNPFYQTKFRAADITAPPASLEEFFQLTPFTVKSELARDQHEHPPFGTNLTFDLSAYSRFNQTSATSGAPLRWLDTAESWQWMLDNWKVVFQAAGVTSADRIFFAFSFGPFLGFWTAFEAAAQLRCLCIPGGGMSSYGRLKAILDNRATVICCTPTYALHLLETAAAENIDTQNSAVRRIIVGGEPGGSLPAVRRKIEQGWGAALFDHHGMTEIGPVTFECPQNPGRLHVIEAEFIAEIVDPRSGQPVGDGVTGELVLTNLGRCGSPLLRYRTGDLVCKSACCPCECGRSDFGLEGGILGRADDMLVIRGVNVFPSAVDDLIQSERAIVEYRVRVAERAALKELEVEIEVAEDAGDGAAVAQQLQNRFRETFHLRVPVRPAPGGSLPRFEMKARRWVFDQQD